MGPNTANSGYVEAIVTKPVATYFLRALGVSTITVSARAVAYEGNGPNCIYVLNPSASGAFSANGNVNSEEQLRADGGFELVERHDDQRQRDGHGADDRSGWQLHQQWQFELLRRRRRPE